VEENLAALGESPIRDGAPAGESVKYDADFETLKSEIEKLDSVTAQAEPDWRLILTLAERILARKSKDILVASYLVFALMKERGYAGLRDGLTVYTAILTNFWDGLFPEAHRMRGRVAALSWLMERLPRLVERQAPGAHEADAVRACEEAFGSFFDQVRVRFESDSPGMGDLKSAIERRVVDLPAKAPPPPEPAAAVPATPGAPPPAAAPRPAAPPPAAAAIGEISSPQDAQKALNATALTLRTAATVLRKANPADPLPYRVLRFASWLPIRAAPPASGGETQLPPPRPQVIDAAATLTAAGDWASLLELGEGRTADTPFWLDASRHTATALAGMGPGHEPARQEVISSLAGLLKRVPGLLDLRFKEGVPFVDDQTKLWIGAEVMEAPGGGGSGGGATPSGGDDAAIQSAKGEARKLLAGGKFAEAMAIFQHGTSGASSRRDRFRWKLALAEAISDAGQTELAMHQLESLEQEAEDFKLDEWEPSLCTGVVVLLYKCQKKLLAGAQKGSPEAMAAAGRTYARLCRIDPVAAMELK
jgi:type VI secretion system protein VasJ